MEFNVFLSILMSKYSRSKQAIYNNEEKWLLGLDLNIIVNKLCQ